MNRLFGWARDFARARAGATSIEYALIAVIISLGVVTMASTVGENSNATYVTLSEQMG